jgi:uncharacterized membrane protein YraQ (UPF0718 family)
MRTLPHHAAVPTLAAMAVRMMDRRIVFSYWLSIPTIRLLNSSAAMQLYVKLSGTATGPGTTTTASVLLSALLLAAVAGLMVPAQFCGWVNG